MLESQLIKPRIIAGVSYDETTNCLKTPMGDCRLETYDAAMSHAMLARWIRQMNGVNSTQTMFNECESVVERDHCVALIEQLDQLGLLDETVEPLTMNALVALFEIEDQMNALVSQLIFTNPFWQKMDELREQYPKSVLYGFAIENYHFLYRESLFDSPILSYPASEKIRLMLNEFYVEEIGHDRLIQKALKSIGFDEAQLANRLPLPATMMMCHSLSHWAATDPHFFFITLSLLEGGDYRPENTSDSFIEACQTAGIDQAFIKPIQAHADINAKANHGNLTREIFACLPPMTFEEIARIKRKLPLFVEMYNRFYEQVFEHYQAGYLQQRQFII